MGSDERSPTTAIGRADADEVIVRGERLTDDLMGSQDFGSVVHLLLTGEDPTEAETRIANALLVTLVDHGVTPSVIAARLTHGSAPEALQGAVASGLLGVGSRYLGSMEDCAKLLQARAPYSDVEAAAEEAIDAADGRFPGIGHGLHEDGDPRAERLFAIADEEGVTGDHVALLRGVSDALEDRHGTRLPVNATGAIAAVASDSGYGWRVAKGFAIVGRAAGLVAHLGEEMEQPTSGAIWDLVASEFEYAGE